MILSGIVAASGKKAGPPSPDPPPALVYQIVGEPNTYGSAGGTHKLPGQQHPRPAVHDRGRRQDRRPPRLLSWRRHAELPHEPVRRPSGLPGDLLAVVEGQAPGAQGWHELALDPPHHLEVTDTTILWVGAQTGANIDSRAPSGGAANSGRRLRSFTFDNGAPDPGTRSYEEQNALFRRGRFGNPAAVTKRPRRPEPAQLRHRLGHRDLRGRHVRDDGAALRSRRRGGPV